MRRLALAVLALATSSALAAEPTLKPFVLASRGPGEATEVVVEVKARLAKAGLEVVGTYEPYAGATVIAVTSEEAKATAAKTPAGGYAAAQRVTVTKVGDEVQVAYTNPVYLAAAYRLDGDLAGVAKALEAALGKVEEFGLAEGKTAAKLRKYHYMVGMEYFDEPSKLGRFGSHEGAVKAVEDGLAAKAGGASRVYRIDLPGGEQTVFGVALTDGCSGDERLMKEIDAGPLRSTGHLPYELLVAGPNVYALYARFRIAMNFPDLKMMGAHSFMNIRCAPDAIEGALKKVTGQ